MHVGDRFAKVGGDATALLTRQRAVWMHRREVAALFVESEPGPPRPLHGAPHPPQCRQDDPRTPVAGQEQWLADGDRLGLIDFDRAQPRRLRPDGDERAARRLR